MKSHKHSKNKQRILDTAYALFDEKGYKKTTMRDIAINSGGSLGAVTNYFRKKSDIAKVLYQDNSKDFYTQIRNIYSKLELSTIEADTVYLCTSAITNVTMPKRIRFLYEVGQEGLLTDILLETIFMQFVRKNNYLNLGMDNESLLVDTLFYIGIYHQMVVGIHSGLIKDIDKAIRIFNIRHLQQLNFSKEKIDEILEVALPISYGVEIKENDIFDVYLKYPPLD